MNNQIMEYCPFNLKPTHMYFKLVIHNAVCDALQWIYMADIAS